MTKIKNIAFLSIIIAVISKFSGFLRDILLSYHYGASNISDAYMISYTIPFIIVGLAGEAIATGFVPRYTRIEKNRGKSEADLFTNNLLSIMIIFSTIIVFSFLLLKKIILKLIFPGLNLETFVLTMSYLNITIWSIYPLLLVYILMGIAQIKLRFLKLSLISLPMNITFLISIILSDYYGTYLLPFGILIGIASQTLVFYKEIKELSNTLKLNFDFKNAEIRSLFLMSIPVLLSVSVNQLNNVVDMNMASFTQEGGISIINYSNRINTLLHGVVALTIANMCYPIFAKHANNENYKSLNEINYKVLRNLTIILVPITIYLMFFSNSIVDILYARGSFTTSDEVLTSTVMQMYILGVLPIAYREIISRLFYSFNNTKAPFISAVIGVLTNIILNVVLSNLLGLKGLALASSIAAIVTTLFLCIFLKKKHSEILFTDINKMLVKFFPIIILILIELFTLQEVLFKYKLLGVIINILLATILYLILLAVFKVIKLSEFNEKINTLNKMK
ncbi:murein biosynthesis integral membrane protein MurJ [Macrococcus epidermidis]|uniref:murein biosynthesis integral membrane protein MurJ n=1 Tax=Macrococcus epidermidis TaxID=1902580 RepID=UPI0020B85B23|nr:murein biosynthesis integral membrane protein MurJ [Macrococcus epidermidis]UTH15985.1 murein biosynthesis integral membrane protein MurJ [Macrococcus epidermidis]